MKLRKLSFTFLAALLATTSLTAIGCSSTTVEEDNDVGALADLEVSSSGWEMDIDKMNVANPDQGLPIRTPGDAFSVLIKAGDTTFRANTHLFTKQVNIIPYANPDANAAATAAGASAGDEVIGQYIRPGEVGFMIKHHRTQHRSLLLDGAGDEMKENFKLQDSHIGIIVGVDRGGKAGAISINNPKTYEQGAFGSPDYQMIFVKPTFPAGVTPAMQNLYNANIRAMAVLFNTVSVFPGDYNGGDALAARNPAQLKTHVAMMVKAIGGDPQAKAFFADPANKIYCAELAHVAASAGILFPLNKTTIQDALGGDPGDTVWNKFTAAVSGGWPFDNVNGANPRLADLKSVKPDLDTEFNQLRPISAVAQPGKRQDGQPSAGLAFEPMTMADIVQGFLRLHVPREPALQENTPFAGKEEGVAPLQGEILAKMEEGLFKSMEIPAGDSNRARKITDDAELMRLPASLPNVAFGDQACQAKPTAKCSSIKDVFDALVKVVSTPAANYKDFQKNVQPWMVLARKITGPRGDTGDGLFVPPSLLHIIALGGHSGGYLGLQYQGHGVHFTNVKKSTGASAPAGPAANNGGATPPPKAPPSGPAAPRFGQAGGGN